MTQYRIIRNWKYQLLEDYQFHLCLYQSVDLEFLSLSDGILTIREGYAWDGASGPTFDTPCTMRASLIHDALYQLMRIEKLSLSHRKYADKLLRDIIIQDGKTFLNKVRAWYFYLAVRIFARGAARPRAEKDDLSEF